MIIVFFHKVQTNTIFIKSTSPIRGTRLDLIFFIVQLVATGLYKYTFQLTVLLLLSASIKPLSFCIVFLLITIFITKILLFYKYAVCL